MQSFTLVTAIIDIRSEGPEGPEETCEYKLENLCKFLNLYRGRVIIFVDREYVQLRHFPMAQIILFDYLRDSWIYAESVPYKDSLPSVRNHIKDTFAHLCLTQMKIEFLQKAIEKCGNNERDIFAWINPQIYSSFKTPVSTINYLNYLSLQHFSMHSVVFPGCWEKPRTVDYNNVCWRFSGNFFFGTASAISELHSFYNSMYAFLLRANRKITWDVNMFAQLEDLRQNLFIWYKGNHDDSVFSIPTALYSANLSTCSDKISIKLPIEIPGFFPSSSSILDNLLFTRYVNYIINPDGKYTVFNVNGQLQTVNVMSTGAFGASNSCIITDSNIGLQRFDKNKKYAGLEDVRVHRRSNGQIGFVASSTTYVADHTIRIIKGIIQVDDAPSFVDGVVLQPPSGVHSTCEKNWIPLDKDDHYIYRWHPYEIVKTDGEGHTEIIASRIIHNTLFEKVRGSSAPVWYEKDSCYVCVVHWAEHNEFAKTLQYYHMLVRLDREYNVIAWSNPFHFVKIGIEYCLGFALKDGNYEFWFSQNDGNPAFMCSCSSQFSFVTLDGKCAESKSETQVE